MVTDLPAIVLQAISVLQPAGAVQAQCLVEILFG